MCVVPINLPLPGTQVSDYAKVSYVQRVQKMFKLFLTMSSRGSKVV
jgi:hypothetical protein